MKLERHHILQEPGKTRPSIKLARAFIVVILFSNVMENTLLKGKFERPEAASGITVYLRPMVHVLLSPRWDAGWAWVQSEVSATARAARGLILLARMHTGWCMRSR